MTRPAPPRHAGRLRHPPRPRVKPLGLPPDPLLDDLLARARTEYLRLEADPALVCAVRSALAGACPARAARGHRWVAAAAAIFAAAIGGWAARSGRSAEGAPGPAPSCAVPSDPSAADDRLRAILASASALPDPAPEVLALWREALDDPDDDVRRAAHALLSAAGKRPPAEGR